MNIYHADGSFYQTIVDSHDGGVSPMAGLEPPVLVDLDGDGDIEILYTFDGIYAYHHNGSPVDGWPHYYEVCDEFTPDLCFTQPFRGFLGFVFSPIVGDIDLDGDLEVMAMEMFSWMHVWEADGTPLPNWPVALSINDPAGFLVDAVVQPLTLGNIDGDPEQEIIVNSGVWEVFALNVDASIEQDFPIGLNASGTYLDSFGAIIGVTLADLDGDSDVELITKNADGITFAFDIPDGVLNPRSDWSTVGQNERHTNFFARSYPDSPPQSLHRDRIDRCITPSGMRRSHFSLSKQRSRSFIPQVNCPCPVKLPAKFSTKVRNKSVFLWSKVVAFG